MDITQPEGGRVRVCGVCIFSWPQKEIETEEEHVGDCLTAWGISTVAEVCCMGDDGEWDGFYTCWWWVLFFVGAELSGEAKV